LKERIQGKKAGSGEKNSNDMSGGGGMKRGVFWRGKSEERKVDAHWKRAQEGPGDTEIRRGPATTEGRGSPDLWKRQQMVKIVERPKMRN